MKLKAISATVLSAIMATTAMVPLSAFADQQPSVEYTGGNGDPITHLYLIADDSELANNHDADWNKVNAKVEVPVAIHYVAQADGTIAGPSDNLAQIRNFSGFPVNVSNIKVTAETGVTFVSTPEAADTADEIYLQMKPNSGTVLSLGDYTPSATETTAGSGNGLGKRPTAGAEWNIAAAVSGVGTSAAQASILNLNALSGKIGGFNTLNPAADTEIGQITWTVKPGTYAVSKPAIPTASTLASTSLDDLSAIGDYITGAGKTDTEYISSVSALIGNDITVTLKNNETLSAKLVNVDAERGLTFVSNRSIMSENMNQIWGSSGNTGGWSGSVLKTSMNSGSIYNQYFQGTELDSVVRTVTNESYDYNDNVNGVGGNISSDRFWIPSYDNIFGTTYTGHNRDSAENTQFTYFATLSPVLAQYGDSRLIRLSPGESNGANSGWWLRTAGSMATSFRSVGYDGNSSGESNPNAAYCGVVPCFCL